MRLIASERTLPIFPPPSLGITHLGFDRLSAVRCRASCAERVVDCDVALRGRTLQAVLGLLSPVPIPRILVAPSVVQGAPPSGRRRFGRSDWRLPAPYFDDGHGLPVC